MSETTVQPRAFALSLIRTTALDDAVHRGSEMREPLPPNMAMYHDVTNTLESWSAAGVLRENVLLVVEWLGTELVAYAFQHFGGDKGKLDRWLHEVGDEVCRSQQHPHPAGPTAMALLSVLAEDVVPGPQGPDAVRLAQLVVPYQGYIRQSQEVEDTREIVLTLGLWAGPWLASLMHYDVERITGYLDSRIAGVDVTDGGTR